MNELARHGSVTRTTKGPSRSSSGESRLTQITTSLLLLGSVVKGVEALPEALDALRQAAALAPTRRRQFWLGILYARWTRRIRDPYIVAAAELDSAGTSKNTGIALRQLGSTICWVAGIRARSKSSSGLGDRSDGLAAWLWLAQGYQNSGDRAKACEAYRAPWSSSRIRRTRSRAGRPWGVDGAKEGFDEAAAGRRHRHPGPRAS